MHAIYECGQGKQSLRTCVPAYHREWRCASVSVVTDVLMKKYVDAIPLYRQEQMWKRMGTELRCDTMASWGIQVADLYLHPFWK